MESTESTPQEGRDQEHTDDPYSSKSSRAYSEWIKAQREAFKDDPDASKFLRLSKDNHARLYQLQQMEPRGIDGIREKYAMLDSVVHGELKGVDAVGALQDELRSVQEMDERLFSGDANALKEMGDEFVQQALPKLAGPILEMVRDSNPEAYAAAVLPHFVEALKSSELVSSFNGLVDILNEAPPKWLTREPEDHVDGGASSAGHGSWQDGWGSGSMRSRQKRVNCRSNRQECLKTAGEKPSELDTLRKEQETQHWNTTISSRISINMQNRTFSKLFAPYAKRLRLDAKRNGRPEAELYSGCGQKVSGKPCVCVPDAALPLSAQA